MYTIGSPEREPQLDAFSEARALRTRAIDSGVANIAIAVEIDTPVTPPEDAQVIDMQNYYNDKVSQYYRDPAA